MLNPSKSRAEIRPPECCEKKKTITQDAREQILFLCEDLMAAECERKEGPAGTLVSRWAGHTQVDMS